MPNDPMYSYDIIQHGSRHCNSHLLMYEWSIMPHGLVETPTCLHAVCALYVHVYMYR